MACKTSRETFTMPVRASWAVAYNANKSLCCLEAGKKAVFLPSMPYQYWSFLKKTDTHLPGIYSIHTSLGEHPQFYMASLTTSLVVKTPPTQPVFYLLLASDRAFTALISISFPLHCWFPKSEAEPRSPCSEELFFKGGSLHIKGLSSITSALPNTQL